MSTTNEERRMHAEGWGGEGHISIYPNLYLPSMLTKNFLI
jgi:hypothetical protein